MIKCFKGVDKCTLILDDSFKIFIPDDLAPFLVNTIILMLEIDNIEDLTVYLLDKHKEIRKVAEYLVKKIEDKK